MGNHSGPMACPVDGATLIMSERQGIEIDYCPTCRGVWLDRGELDKIIERTEAQNAPPPTPQAAQPAPHPQSAPWGQQPQYDDRYREEYRGKKPYKRRKSFLEELFD
nr:zf-TFIIB domain-containing protein [uncultured Sphingomonas sp.]